MPPGKILVFRRNWIGLINLKAAQQRINMTLELTRNIDRLRDDVEKLLTAPKLPPKKRAALTEIMQLLSEAADAAEEAEL